MDVVKIAVNSEQKHVVVRDIINKVEGHFFYVYFLKKDGNYRQMTCRRHVLKGVKGTAKYDVEEIDKKNHQITVFDVQKASFRKINLDKVNKINADNIRYVFVDYVEKPKKTFRLNPLLEDYIIEQSQTDTFDAESLATLMEFMNRKKQLLDDNEEKKGFTCEN